MDRFQEPDNENDPCEFCKEACGTFECEHLETEVEEVLN